MYTLKLIFFTIIFTFIYTYAQAKQITYTFDIKEEKNKVSGKSITKYLINNSSPGPVLKANKGDTLKIIVINNSNADLIIHWHGVLVDNNQDGVAPITQPAIPSHTTYTYEILVKQTGTYWYHAHGLEEASGIFGGIIFNDEKTPTEEGQILLFNGKLNQEPSDVLNGLTGQQTNNAHTNHGGHNNNTPNLATNNNHKMHNSPSMQNMMNHYSDITFYKHLINNKSDVFKIENITNNKIKLRIINAYIDGFLNFVYSGGEIEIIASDGINTKPVKVKNLRVAMGETYDVILNVPSNKSYELVAFVLGTAEFSKVIINNGSLVTLPSYNYKDYSITSPYAIIESVTPEFVNFSTYKNTKNLNFSLKGNHENYSWGIYNKRGSTPLENLNLTVGDKVKIKITNTSMMPHPMHLHGFFFKVTSAKNNLIKHTMNIEHMETIEIEFIVDKEGKWVFHCHNLFHMASNMMLTFNVEKQ